MAQKNNNSLYIILALILCALLLSPYLGLFNLLGPSRETPPSSTPIRPPTLERDSDGFREEQRQKQDTQKKKLSEIEQLLN